MILRKKYAIGVHVMFYEIEIYSLYIDGLLNMLSTVENLENIEIDICFNVSQFLETIDTTKTDKEKLIAKFYTITSKLNVLNIKVNAQYRDNDNEFYSQSNYRREFNAKYCLTSDYVIWGETDSLFPKEALQALETLAAHTDANGLHKYIVCFADRKMWDESWNPTVHKDYEHLTFVDDANASDNPDYAKSPMSIERMNEINSKVSDFEFTYINYPKLDGSCLVFTSDLIKAGVNIPLAFVHNDDEAIARMAQSIMGGAYMQFICKNLLKVHARRHPQKRLYVKDENNPKGFCGPEKGEKWLKFRKLTSHNIQNLTTQAKLFTFKDL
jgi:hypothetical protein